MMQIPSWPVADKRERDLIDQVLASPQWGGYHPIVAQFEQAFASAHGCRYGVSAANGTLTIEMLLACAGIGPGDEVIVPAISFVSTATAVSRVGATPVFVDIEPYTFNMDADSAERAVSPRTKAIMPVHFGGPLADMDRLMALASRHGILMIEDAAHAHGSAWSGRKAGSFGFASSFSFQNGKVMTAGEGGIVLTNDEEFAARMRSFANQGRRPGHSHFQHFTLASNLRLTGLQAAVLTAQLERLPAQIATRARNAGLLKSVIGEAEGMHWQEIPEEVTANSWYLLMGRIEERRFGMSRNEFCKMMTDGGVPCSPYYPHTLYQNPLYQQGGCRVMPCPNAEASIRDSFWIPHYVLLAAEDTAREIAEVLAKRSILVK